MSTFSGEFELQLNEYLLSQGTLDKITGMVKLCVEPETHINTAWVKQNITLILKFFVLLKLSFGSIFPNR